MWLSVGLKIIPYLISSLQSFTFLSHKVITGMNRKLFSLIKCFFLACSCLRMQRIYIYIINIRTLFPRCINWVWLGSKVQTEAKRIFLNFAASISHSGLHPKFSILYSPWSIRINFWKDLKNLSRGALISFVHFWDPYSSLCFALLSDFSPSFFLEFKSGHLLAPENAFVQ